MNELIKVELAGEKPTVLGRDLHAALEVDTQYSKWFERMTEFGFAEDVDFLTVVKNVYREDGTIMPQTQNDHQLTLEMAKEICMLQRTDKGKECRQYFIELERRWNDPTCLMARALVAADKQIASLREINAKIKELSFAPGKRDMDELTKLKNNKVTLSNRIARTDLPSIYLFKTKIFFDICFLSRL